MVRLPRFAVDARRCRLARNRRRDRRFVLRQDVLLEAPSGSVPQPSSLVSWRISRCRIRRLVHAFWSPFSLLWAPVCLNHLHPNSKLHLSLHV